MQAINLPLRMEEGSVFNEHFVVMTSTYLRYNFVTRMVRMTIRASPTSATVLAEINELNRLITIGGATLDRSLGSVAVVIPATITKDYNWNAGWYNVEIVPFTVGTDLGIGAFGANYTSVAIDPIGGGSGFGTLTANHADANFSGSLSVGNLIQLTSSENLNDGIYDVKTVTTTVITINTNLAGTVGAADVSVKIYPISLTETNTVRLLEGSVINSRETVRT